MLTILVALLALACPSFAAGLCAANGQPPVVSVAANDASVPLPSPCEMQGGKRVLPARPYLDRIAVELPRATASQWARGLADQPIHEGLAPAAELPPPRLG